MSDSKDDIEILYWPIPFRGNYLKVILEDAGVPYETPSADKVAPFMRKRGTMDQSLPMFAPPFLRINDLWLNQLPASAQFLAKKYGYEPSDPYLAAVALKVLLDVNDVLAEVTRGNGSRMWDKEAWETFTNPDGRFPTWLKCFELLGQKYGLTEGTFLLGGEISYADLAIFTLFRGLGRMGMSEYVAKYAPTLCEHVGRLAQRERLADFEKRQATDYQAQFCGGQIEASIKAMVEASE
jgi:glutathione S-transferase